MDQQDVNFFQLLSPKEFEYGGSLKIGNKNMVFPRKTVEKQDPK